MGRVTVQADLPVQASVAEALWYDLGRWPAFVDGFGHVVKADGAWPQAGATVMWDSVPGGRGRVLETVDRYEARVGQRVEVDDERMRGTQDIRFDPREDGVRVTLALDYRLKQANPLSAVFDLLFVRRPMRDSLRRTLLRFRRELLADRDLVLG